MISRILIALCLLATTSYSQIYEDFTDGDFTQNPTWSGDVSQFIVSSGQLKLNSTGTDTSSLSFSSTALQGSEWHIWVKFSFNPTSGNYGRVYLGSNQSNLSGSLNGYFVQLGGVGSFDDIRLFRQDGLTAVQLMDGPDTTLSGSTNQIRLKVTCDAVGLWTVMADKLGGQNFELQGTVSDNTYSASSAFGIWCKYTGGNSTNFYFDDIYTGPIIVDNTPPALVSALAVSANKLDLTFDEGVTALSAQEIANYTVNNSIGNPATATLDLSDVTLVHLTFANNFTSGTSYQVTATNIQDGTGNTIVNGTANFTFYHLKQYDVVFNEIMPDPSPTQGLPEVEYIEIFNRTAYPISINNWTITAGSSVDVLPNAVIAPNAYLILLASSAYPNYIDKPNALEVTGLSYQALTNDGQTITLRDTAGNLIHSITYSIDWFNDGAKDEGGWSIEQIDAANPCGGITNWEASIDPAGGTPGVQNSVFAANPDNVIPDPIKVVLVDENTIKVFFDEPLDSLSALNASAYSVDNAIGQPASVSIAYPEFNAVTLDFAQNFAVGTIYTLTIQNFIRDCVGNILDQTVDLKFAVPQFPAANEVVLNELLSDPKDGGVDYTELYNRSMKVINLSDIYIARYDAENLPETWYQAAPDGYVLFPGEDVLVAEDIEVVKNQYSTPNPKAFVLPENLPDFNIDDGSCILGDSLGNIIDAFVYDSKMHFPLLKSTKGVSLERLNPERPTSDRGNWHSAAETVGFGTPAYQNSQFNENSTEGDFLTIAPPIFSPDNDGYQDILNITLKSDNPGNVATLQVFDAKGRLVKKLLENELLGTNDTFTWDGISDRGDKARIGVYILLTETFDTAGNKKKVKKTFVLGENF